MKGKRLLGPALIVLLLGVTLYIMLREQSLEEILTLMGTMQPVYVAAGLLLMFLFVSCEAVNTHLILRKLGHQVGFGACLGYAFVGFFCSSITPSSSGGQPAQIYYMSKGGIPAGHGSVDMMLIAICYQSATILHAVIALFLVPAARARMLGPGLRVLLFYGFIIQLALTGWMLAMMFLPNSATRFMHWLLRVGVKLRLVRHPERAKGKLDAQLAQYRHGAQSVKAHLSLIPIVLGMCMLQLVCLYGVPYMVYLGFGLTGASLLDLVGAQALVSLAVGSLPLPGAVGASEGTATLAFTLFFGVQLAVPAVLVSRGISFYIFLLISAAVTLAVHLRPQKEAV